MEVAFRDKYKHALKRGSTMWISSKTKSRLDIIEEEEGSGTVDGKSDLIVESIESDRKP